MKKQWDRRPGFLKKNATPFLLIKAKRVMTALQGSSAGQQYRHHRVLVYIDLWETVLQSSTLGQYRGSRPRSLGSSFGAFIWIAVSMVSMASQKPWFSLHPSGEKLKIELGQKNFSTSKFP
jgi:hypothetical protein